MDRVKRIWYLSPMRAAKVQVSLRIRAVSPEPSLLAHTSSESRGTFRQKARSVAPLNGWACAVEICHDGMLEDTNSLDGAQLKLHVLEPKQNHVNFYKQFLKVAENPKNWVTLKSGFHNMSHLMTKATKWHLRPAMTQISLGIQPVWSESLLCALWVAKDPRFLHMESGWADLSFCWICCAAAQLLWHILR